MEFPKILESKAKIRFQDCDPFNHLNNAAYFNYLINAREDQVIKAYDLDVYQHGKKTGKSWVVGTHQISYLKPAVLMETITIETQLINYNNKALSVELRMWNEAKTELKAFLWSSFIYFDLKKLKATEHSEELLKLFEKAVLPLKETRFEERARNLRVMKK